MTSRKRSTRTSKPASASMDQSSQVGSAPSSNPGGTRERSPAWDPFDPVKALDSIGAYRPIEVQVGGEVVVCVVTEHRQLFRHPEMKLVTAPVTGWRRISKQ